jgi:hypothetical protein
MRAIMTFIAIAILSSAINVIPALAQESEVDKVLVERSPWKITVNTETGAWSGLIRFVNAGGKMEGEVFDAAGAMAQANGPFSDFISAGNEIALTSNSGARYTLTYSKDTKEFRGFVVLPWRGQKVNGMMIIGPKD